MSNSNYSSLFSNKKLSEHIEDYRDSQEAYKDGGKFPIYLKIEADAEAEVLFLPNRFDGADSAHDPLKFWQHSRLWDQTLKNGQGGYCNYTCTNRADCPLCVAGNAKTFKVAWQVVDTAHMDKDNNVVPRVKLWVQGIRFAEYFERKSSKFDITKEVVLLERIGKGTNTQYTFERLRKTELPAYDEEEVIDLEEFFGLDDERYANMQRLAADISGSKARAVSQKPSTDTKTKKRSKLDEDDEGVGVKW